MLWLERIRARTGKPPAGLLKAVQPLVKEAHNADPVVRMEAIAALTHEPIALVAHTLLDCLSDRHDGVRLAAAQALLLNADPAHRKHFLKLLADDNFEVRVAAIQFLGRIADPDLAHPLVASLADSDSDVRHAAAIALGELRNAVAIEPLVVLLADAEPVVRRAAVAALEQINRRWIRSDAARRAFPRLKALCKDPQPWIAAAAQKAVSILSEAKGADTEFWNRKSGIRNL